MRKLSMNELGRKTVGEFRQAPKNPVVLILDNIRSMHNVGSVFRTADAFLVEGICLCGYTPRPPHRDIQKTALGATETVNWEYFSDVTAAIQSVRQKGYRVVAAEQTVESMPLQQLAPDGPLAVVLGNEVEGVSAEALAICDGSIEIPQSGTKHSLNVSVAAGIILWELCRGTLSGS